MAVNIIISGGGTGGHIFPAIAIANALQKLAPDTNILFVGAEGRMEMEKVPAAGYKIIGLDIQGINRSSLWKNLQLPFKLLASMRKARVIIREFNPHVAVGVGGYASGPLLLAAKGMGIPYLIQEQNSYAGLTNKRLGGSAQKICVAFEGMEKFFPAGKILLSGNPIRRAAIDISGKSVEAQQFFGLDPDKACILITGGSLGARTLNLSLLNHLDLLRSSGVQVLWQCGPLYYEKLKSQVEDYANVHLHPFLQRMDLAYAAADLIVSRAGAGTIAELCAIGKPVILVPSPNVAEDHQTKNAMALATHEAAIVITDVDAPSRLIPHALELLEQPHSLSKLSANISTLAKTDADEVIAREILKIAEGKQ